MRIGIAGNGMIVRRMLQDIKEIPEIETTAGSLTLLFNIPLQKSFI